VLYHIVNITFVARTFRVYILIGGWSEVTNNTFIGVISTRLRSIPRASFGLYKPIQYKFNYNRFQVIFDCQCHNACCVISVLCYSACYIISVLCHSVCCIIARVVLQRFRIVYRFEHWDKWILGQSDSFLTSNPEACTVTIIYPMPLNRLLYPEVTVVVHLIFDIVWTLTLLR
jgi:hypothetical protein